MLCWANSSEMAGEGDMPAGGVDQVGVDLVHGDHDAVVYTDASDPLQLLPCPGPAHRVVGAAQQHELGLGVSGQLLQLGKVDLIAPVVIYQLVERDPALGLVDIVVIGVVDGGLDDDALPRLGIHLNGAHQGHVDARGEHDPVRLDLPAVAAFLPAGAGLEIFAAGIAVAVCLMGGPLPDGRGYRGRHLVVHVRDAHGDNIALPEHPHMLLGGPLNGDGLGAVDHAVKVVLHAAVLL